MTPHHCIFSLSELLEEFIAPSLVTWTSGSPKHERLLASH